MSTCPAELSKCCEMQEDLSLITIVAQVSELKSLKNFCFGMDRMKVVLIKVEQLNVERLNVERLNV